MNNDDLERDLRRVLADPGHRLPDRLVPLERVHAGAARRRRQRQGISASLAVLAVVGLGLGVARPWSSGAGSDVISGSSVTPPVSSGTQSSPAISSPSAVVSSSQGLSSTASPSGSEILSHVGSVSSVTAINDSHWWVAAAIDGCSGCGSTLLSTTDDGQHFSVVSHGGKGSPGDVAVVRFVDKLHGSAVTTDGMLWDTRLGGRDWTTYASKTAGPREKGFFALEAGGSQTTYALQQSADASIHLWVHVGTGTWRDIATLDNTATPGPLNVQLAVQGDRAVVVWRTSKAVVSASYEPSGAFVGTTTLTDCDFTLGLSTLSSGMNAVWLSCHTGTADTILTSKDYGATWGRVTVPGDAGRHVVGAIDTDHAVISTSVGLGVLATDGTLQDGALPGQPGPRDWSYIGFTNPTHGFALTTSGTLLRSDDGGQSWQTVVYPG